MESVFLGIDVGTSSVKAALVTGDGRTVGAGTAPLSLARSEDLAAEQEAEDWWQGARRAFEEALAGAGPRRVRAIGLTGQKHALLGLDAAHRPLAPARLWCDGRALEEAAALAREGARRGRRAGGTQPPGFLVPKWHRWRREDPDLAGRVRHLCFAKDWIRYRLAGRLATDPTEAATTGAYDATRRAWSSERAARIGLPLDLLPEVVPSNGEGGRVEGISPALDGALVVGGAGDNEAAALACAALERGEIAVILGTSGTVIGRVGRSRVPRGLVAGPGPLRRGTFGTGVLLDAGGALTWIRDAAFPPGTPIEDVLHAAAATPPGPAVPLFVPSLGGARSPVPDGAARGAFLGLEPRTGRGELARAVAEGIAAQLGRIVTLLVGARHRARAIRLTSGGASPFLAGLVANACDAPVRIVGGGQEPARGAALLAASAGATDRVLAARAQSWLRAGPEFEPHPEGRARLADVAARLGRAERIGALT